MHNIVAGIKTTAGNRRSKRFSGGSMKPDPRERILKTARELFAKYTPWKTTMDELAKKARVGKTTLYKFYPDKEDVMEAVFEQDMNAFWGEVYSQQSKARDPEDKLRIYFHVRQKAMKKMTANYNVFEDDFAHHFAVYEKIRKRYFDREISLIKEIFDEGKAKGIFIEFETDTGARSIVFALKGLEQDWNYEKDMEKVNKRIDTMVNVIIYGLKPR